MIQGVELVKKGNYHPGVPEASQYLNMALIRDTTCIVGQQQAAILSKN